MKAVLCLILLAMCAVATVSVVSAKDTVTICLMPMINFTAFGSLIEPGSYICDPDNVHYLLTLGTDPSDAVIGNGIATRSLNAGYTTTNLKTEITRLVIPFMPNGNESIVLYPAIPETESSNGYKCFDGESLVVTTNGVKQLAELKVGDEILTGTGEYQPLLGWLHRDPHTLTIFHRLSTAYGSISATAQHFIMGSPACKGNAVPMMVQDLGVGDCLLHYGGNKVPIQERTVYATIGSYAPYMDADTFYIGNSGPKFILATPYAVTYPSAYLKAALAAIMKFDASLNNPDLTMGIPRAVEIAHQMYNWLNAF